VSYSLGDFLDEITRGLLTLFGPWSEHVSEREWVLDGPLSVLRVRIVDGSVEVRGADQAGVTVRAETTVRGPMEGLAAAFADRVYKHVVKRGEAVHIHTVYPKPPLGCSVYVRYEISVPRQMDVDVYTENGGVSVMEVEGAVEAETWSGNIELRDTLGPATVTTSNGSLQLLGLEGSIEAESGNGSCTVRGVQGHVRLRTTHGDVRVTGAEGTVKARSHSGNLELRQVSGGVTLETVAGDIDATLDRVDAASSLITRRGAIRLACARATASINAESLDGDITLALPSEFAGKIDAGTDEGDVRCELPIDPAQRSRRLLVGSLGADGPTRLILRTFRGDVDIRDIASRGDRETGE
jgi:DUF4097 and DUF4098 domain-containing protein YvlB